MQTKSLTLDLARAHILTFALTNMIAIWIGYGMIRWCWILNKLIELPSKWDCKSIKIQFTKRNYFTLWFLMWTVSGFVSCVHMIVDVVALLLSSSSSSNDNDNKSSIQLVGQNLTSNCQPKQTKDWIRCVCVLRKKSLWLAIRIRYY